MLLQVLVVPGAEDGLMVRVDSQSPAINLIYEMPDRVFNSKELTSIGAIPLLFWT